MRRVQVLALVVFCYIVQDTEEVIHNSSGKVSPNYKLSERETFVNKVTLTQIGYIQFLKYINDVPPMTEYTFCIWMRSNNLTHNHPILSYSKHEEERIIRVWIGPYGKNINLEILGIQIFDMPVNIVENRWYHICQSWSSHQAIWALYINGKPKSTGSSPQLRGSFIKGGGDIVVGQEYTDFDKGLEDGIEGDIAGFNFVLSSSISNQKHFHNSQFRQKYHSPQTMKYPQMLPKRHQVAPPRTVAPELTGLEEYKTIPDEENVKPDTTGYAVVEPNRNPKGILDIFRNIFAEQPARVRVFQKYPPGKGFKLNNRRASERFTSNEIGDMRKPLGLLLVEQGFDCGYRKGAPVSGIGVLINWNQTPVRVFGGAILKSVPAFCYENKSNW